MVRQARTLRLPQPDQPVTVRRREEQARVPDVPTSAGSSRGGQVGLRRETRLAADAFVGMLRGSDVVKSGRSADRNLERTVIAHSAFVETVATLCANKMRNENMSPKSVCQAVGVMSAMWMLSPSLRKVVKAQRQDLKAELSRRLDERALVELDQAGGDATALSRKWRKRIETLESAGSEDRQMFTASSAALTMIGLSENASARLRAIGPVTDERTQTAWDAVRAEHQELTDKVYDLAFADGIDPAEVDELIQINLTQHVDQDPTRAAEFEGLTYGAHVRRLDDVSRFYDKTGLPVSAKDLLVPRGPLSPAAHRERLVNAVNDDMERAYDRKDASQLFDRLKEHVRGDDLPAVNFALRADGINDRILRTDMCCRTIELLGVLHPRFKKSMTEIYGDTWSENLIQDLRDDVDMSSTARSLTETMVWDRQVDEPTSADRSEHDTLQGGSFTVVDQPDDELSL